MWISGKTFETVRDAKTSLLEGASPYLVQEFASLTTSSGASSGPHSANPQSSRQWGAVRQIFKMAWKFSFPWNFVLRVIFFIKKHVSGAGNGSEEQLKS